MKEASGELSMTAITVVAIAAIAVVFTTLVWPNIKTNITRSTNCAQAFDCSAAGPNGMRDCSYCTTEDCGTTAKVSCPEQ